MNRMQSKYIFVHLLHKKSCVYYTEIVVLVVVGGFFTFSYFS